MEPCLDPACIGFDVSLPDYLAAAAAGGFRLVEVPITWVAGYGAAATAGLLRHHGLTPAQFTCGLGVPGNIAVPDRLFSDRLAALPPLAVAANEIGCRRASLFCDPYGHEGVPLTSTEVVTRIGTVRAALSARDIALSVGLIGRDLLDRASEIWQGVRAGAGAAADGFGLLVDTVSLAKADLGVGWIDALPPGSIGWLRVADVPEGKAPAELGYADRLLPGRGALPLPDLILASRRRGYAGPVSVEVGEPGLRALAPAERARRALDSVRALLPA